MPFCPVPHTPRDNAWLGIGILTGLAGAVLLRRCLKPLEQLALIVVFEVTDKAQFFAAMEPLVSSPGPTSAPRRVKRALSVLQVSASRAEKGCIQYKLYQVTVRPLAVPSMS